MYPSNLLLRRSFSASSKSLLFTKGVGVVTGAGRETIGSVTGAVSTEEIGDIDVLIFLLIFSVALSNQSRDY